MTLSFSQNSQNRFLAFLFFSAYFIPIDTAAQNVISKNDILVLFIDEAVPKSATKIITKKIKEPYGGYSSFENQIIKFAAKNNGNFAKIDEYHAPDKKKPEHQGTVSIYTFNNMDSLQRIVLQRRDSLDLVQLNDSKENCLVYFFRPRTMIKTPYDLSIDNKFLISMKPDSTAIVRPRNKTAIKVSSRTFSNPTSFTLRLNPGKIYFVECRTTGNPPFTIFPLFSLVDSHVGRYLFQIILEERKESIKGD